MAFWSKKKLFDVLSKEFKNDNVSVQIENNKFTFEVNCSEAKLNLFPYIKLNEETSIMTIIINLKKVQKDNFYDKINAFNLLSKYFTMKLKDSVLFLEYNVMVDTNNVYEMVKEVIDTVKDLQFEIDKI